MWPPWGNYMGCPYDFLPKGDFFPRLEGRVIRLHDSRLSTLYSQLSTS
jgi:hypothetical protein